MFRASVHWTCLGLAEWRFSAFPDDLPCIHATDISASSLDFYVTSCPDEYEAAPLVAATVESEGK